MVICNLQLIKYRRLSNDSTVFNICCHIVLTSHYRSWCWQLGCDSSVCMQWAMLCKTALEGHVKCCITSTGCDVSLNNSSSSTAAWLWHVKLVTRDETTSTIVQANMSIYTHKALIAARKDRTKRGVNGPPGSIVSIDSPPTSLVIALCIVLL